MDFSCSAHMKWSPCAWKPNQNVFYVRFDALSDGMFH